MTALVQRGDEVQTALAHEFDLHEYVWPKLLGRDRNKWERVAALVDAAARNDHQVRCGSHDGRRSFPPPRFVDEHAEHDRARIRLALVALVEAGIPRWLSERSG